MNPLIEQLRKYGPLSAEAELAVAEKSCRLEKKKNDHLLREGQVLASYFVAEKGVFRAYIHRGGKELNVWFGAEQQIFGAILPMYADKPAPENIQLLEDAILCSIRVDDLNALYLQFPELNFIGRKIAEELCVILEYRINSLHFETPAERYHTLLQEHPYLLQRVKLGHIASYLRVTQETLSRIRSSARF